MPGQGDTDMEYAKFRKYIESVLISDERYAFAAFGGKGLLYDEEGNPFGDVTEKCASCERQKEEENETDRLDAEDCELWVSVRMRSCIRAVIISEALLYEEIGDRTGGEIREILLSMLPEPDTDRRGWKNTGLSDRLRGTSLEAAAENGRDVLTNARCRMMLDERDRELYDRLSEIRRDLSVREHIPVYRVFPNRVLLELCRCKPETIEDMLRIKGVGKVNSARYGAAFLSEISRRQDPNIESLQRS